MLSRLYTFQFSLDGKDHLGAVTNRLEPSIMTGGNVQHRDEPLHSGCELDKVAQYRNLSVHAVDTQTEVAYSLRPTLKVS